MLTWSRRAAPCRCARALAMVARWRWRCAPETRKKLPVLVDVMRERWAVTVEGWRTLRNRSQGTVEGKTKRGDRATGPIESIWCEKNRGCSYGGRCAVLNVRYAPKATSSADGVTSPGYLKREQLGGAERRERGCQRAPTSCVVNADTAASAFPACSRSASQPRNLRGQRSGRRLGWRA